MTSLGERTATSKYNDLSRGPTYPQLAGHTDTLEEAHIRAEMCVNAEALEWTDPRREGALRASFEEAFAHSGNAGGGACERKVVAYAVLYSILPGMYMFLAHSGDFVGSFFFVVGADEKKRKARGFSIYFCIYFCNVLIIRVVACAC